MRYGRRAKTEAAPVLAGLHAAAQALRRADRRRPHQYCAPTRPAVGRDSRPREQTADQFRRRPGDRLVAAIDLRGRYREPFSNWEAASDAPPGAAAGRSRDFARDRRSRPRAPRPRTSARAGSSAPPRCWPNVRASASAIDVASVPKPDGVALERWLQTFPSYGYLLAVPADNVAAVIARFAARDIAAAEIGEVTADRPVEHHGRPGDGDHLGFFARAADGLSSG